jgi:hypothetical protein
MTALEDQQVSVARRFGVEPQPPDTDLKVGIARNVKSDLQPLNALRHVLEGDTCGWYIWVGQELSQDPDFFVPLHISHLGEWCPEILSYLALAPGWRVLLAPGYEDVWFDADLL